MYETSLKYIKVKVTP